MKRPVLCFVMLLAALPGAFADGIESIVFKHRIEAPYYVFDAVAPQAVLRMSYAGFEIEDAQPWLKAAVAHVPYEVDLVFTKYPADTSRWRTNYDELLKSRVRELLALDPVFYDKTIRWNMFLQTRCKTESEAKGYFHGFVIRYRPRELRKVSEVNSPEEVRALVSGFVVPADSTVINIVERHPQWKDMLVVMDWTGSMYQYGAQLVLWHRLNLAVNLNRVQHVVFFNDGNKKKTYQKQIGKTGGIYYTDASDLNAIVATMEKVMSSGNGGDSPENDVEALVKATNLLSGYDEVILIADNSAVRDLELIGQLKKPVRVILCDVRSDGYINPDYVKIAYATGGSLHTLKQDLNRLNELKEGDNIQIGGIEYVVQNGAIQMAPRVVKQ